MGAFPRLLSRYLYSVRLNSLSQEMLQELEMIIDCFKFCALITLHYYYYFKFFNFVLLWENFSWVTRRVTRQPELPWTSQRFLNFLIKLWKSFGNHLHEKQKVGLAIETGHRFLDSWVTHQARPTFVHIHVNVLSRLDRSTQSRRDNFCFVKVLLSNQSYLISVLKRKNL